MKMNNFWRTKSR